MIRNLTRYIPPILLTPFFILALFVWPSADDYFMFTSVDHFGQQGVITSLFQTWTGRYSTIPFALLGFYITPNLWLYRFIIFITLLSLFLSVMWFVRKTMAQTNQWPESTSIAAVFMLLWLDVSPGISESFYWYSGVVVYIWPLILFFYIAGVLLSNMLSPLERTMAGIALFVMAGFNELAMGAALTLGVMAALPITPRNLRSIRWWPLIIAITGAVLLLSSPGNQQRMNVFPLAASWGSAMNISVVSLLKTNGIHLISLPIWISAILLFLSVDIGSFHPRLQPFIRLHPVWVFLAGQLFMLVLFFIPAWAMGINPPLRIYGAVSPFWLLWWFWLAMSIKQKLLSYSMLQNFNGKVAFYSLSLLLVLAFLTGVHKIPGGDHVFTRNVTQAWYDLFARAIPYQNQMKKRELLIEEHKSSGQELLSLPALKSLPGTIHFLDITPDPSHWINLNYSYYYQIPKVRVVAPGISSEDGCPETEDR